MTAVQLCGAKQEVFDELVARHGHRLRAIQLTKCPLIHDLQPFEQLPDLRLVSIYWNQRATKLWDLRRTPHLRGLSIEDFTRLHDLSDLAGGTSLNELVMGDAVWNSLVIATLQPLAALTGLRSLTLSAKRIDDGRVEPLAALQQLETLSFGSGQFTTRQVAWLRARLPNIQSDALDPLRRFDKPLRGSNGKQLDVLLAGKRKPFLNSISDAARIARHVADFERMVAAFAADATLSPSD